MAAFIYTLCALTSLVAALLLFRGWRQTRTPLLLWSAVCFAFLAVSNTFLVLDRTIYNTTADLSTERLTTAFVALLILVIGLIWESD